MTIKGLVEKGILKMEENVYLFDDTFLLLAYGVCREPQIIKFLEQLKERICLESGLLPPMDIR